MKPVNKTQPTEESVSKYLESIEDQARRKDAKRLAKIATEVTGVKPVMWGTGIVGFGSYHYVYASGREGDTAAVGFAARKNALAIYGLTDHEENEELLEKLGPHGSGKSCLYIKDLTEVHTGVLKKMIKTAYANRTKARSTHPKK
jgi:hypothetical protein